MTRIGVLAYAGVDELDLVGVYSPLVKAAQCPRHRPELDVVLLGGTPSFQTSGHGYEVEPGRGSSATRWVSSIATRVTRRLKRGLGRRMGTESVAAGQIANWAGRTGTVAPWRDLSGAHWECG